MDTAQQADKPNVSNLTQRVITGLVVLPLVLGAALFGGWVMLLLVLFVACVGVLEFFLLARERESQGSALTGIPAVIALIISFHLSEPLIGLAALIACVVFTFAFEVARFRHPARRGGVQALMTLAGVLYVGFPLGFTVALRAAPDGMVWLLLTFAITWGTDSFGYIGGRLWGKTQLAPRISPKKTREGAIVGVIGGVIPALLLLVLTDQIAALTVVIVLVGPFMAIAGDLLESGLKRGFGVKDSHVRGLDILPGHGGILDRIDGFMLVVTFTYAALWLAGWV